jgi:DNA-binding MarR family transcriptional regulator
MVSETEIARVRSFNRLVTRQAGVVGDRHLGRRPFGESRALYEIGVDGTTPRDLRARLGLDSGYLSRVLGALRRDGLVETTPDPADRRTKRLSLTAAGIGELREINRISDELAAAVLDPRTGEIARMWVDRPHRGLGLAKRILVALEEQAAALGFTTVRLDTNRVLDEARAMYLGAGYVEIPRYNDNPYATHFFEKRLD